LIPVPESAPEYLEFTTSAVAGGSFGICIAYDPADIASSEDKLVLIHYDGDQWEDITTSVDTVQNIICGTTTSLSPFLLAERPGCCIPPTVGDVDQSGGVDITDISVLIDNQFLTLTPLLCEDEGDVDLSGTVDITDVSVLIDNQFLTLTPLPECP